MEFRISSHPSGNTVISEGDHRIVATTEDFWAEVVRVSGMGAALEEIFRNGD